MAKEMFSSEDDFQKWLDDVLKPLENAGDGETFLENFQEENFPNDPFNWEPVPDMAPWEYVANDTHAKMSYIRVPIDYMDDELITMPVLIMKIQPGRTCAFPLVGAN